jgi:phosphate:Na+ symporter
MTAQGWIPFELAAAMVLGENIGTTITANLAAIVANYHAKRTARAHLLFNIIGVIWVLILFYPFLRMISWLAVKWGSESPYLTAAAIPVGISLFHTVFNILNTFALIWFIKPITQLVEKIVPAKAAPEREMDMPKFLTKSVLKYPETLISSLKNESKRLYKKSIFEIVAHALNIHREDIKSDQKLKDIINKSNENMDINVTELYYSKIKKIYGEIIAYATRGQSTLNLSESQTSEILEIKLANRKMVEIVRDVRELSKNISHYLESDNVHVQKQYNKFRKKIAKVLRVIYHFRKDDGQDKEAYYKKLLKLKNQAKVAIHSTNEDIDALIRENLITIDMASSLVNDNDNVNDIVKKLIAVAELLYGETDSLLENGDAKLESLEAAI